LFSRPTSKSRPAAQRNSWKKLDATPEHFTLYGGTALALHPEHRTSVDFDFFSNEPLDPDVLPLSIPYLDSADPA